MESSPVTPAVHFRLLEYGMQLNASGLIALETGRVFPRF
jgi:hypothetical protein